MKKLNRFGLVLTTAVTVLCILTGVKTAKAQQADTIEDGVYIGNVNVGGMTEEQAVSAVEEYVSGLMGTTFTLKGETGSVSMTAEDMKVEADADTAVSAAMEVGHAGSLIHRYKTLQDLKKDKLVMDMHLSVDKQETARKLYEHADELAVGAVDNGLTRENGEFQFVPGKKGKEVDIVNSVYAINDFLADGWNGTDNEIDLVTKEVEPRGSEEELAQITDLLGSYSTNFSSSSAGRAKNVETGCSKVNGAILYPGDEFQLCKTVSPFTQENGYELAGAYQNGTTVESFGGGICQVATTLYNAVIRAELEVTMRFNHSMQVHYVQPSMDAAIAGDYKDLRFKNNLDTPVYIEGYCSGGIIYFNIYGKETRPANREIDFESETVSTVEPKTTYSLNSSLPLGSWSVQQGSNAGCVARLWKIVKVDGVEQSRELFNSSRYQASPRTVTIGTKGATKESLAALKAAISGGNEAAIKSAASALKSVESEKEEEEEEEEKKEEEENSEETKENPQDTEEEKEEGDKNNKPDASQPDTGKTESNKDDSNKKEETKTEENKSNSNKKENTKKA